ncbi:MAG: hypothetical protein QNJ90_11480 [Planctomycetota bacterium]|nr:hypothetical protein [Planctomycetota bacterium]
MRTWWVWILLVVVAVPPARAGEDEAPPTYTPEELAALDRALHAANLTRKDLTFTKDLAKGHECLPIVKEMLRDPLEIAREMDAFVRLSTTWDAGLHAPHGTLIEAWQRLAPSDLDPVGRALRGIPDSREPVVAEDAKPADLLAWATKLAAHAGKPLRLGKEPLSFEDVRYRILRSRLPPAMAWHDVFEAPYSEAVEDTLTKTLEAADDAYLHELAASISARALLEPWFAAFGDPQAWLRELPPSAFPRDKPLVKDTPFGRIALGTPKDDVYTGGQYTVLIDPGGNDRYVGCRIGAAYGTKDRRLGFFADLGGDDQYDCAEVQITMGAAVLGVAAFYDLGMGNDRYRAGHASLGAAMGGCAVFYDDGGTDTYEGRTFTQGAAGFGVAVFYDDAMQSKPELTADEGTKDPVDIGLFDNDRLTAWANAQAFARCRGMAYCINTRGNDTYEAGGVYLHAPLFADRYQSFSQGFAIGERGVDYAGGIAMLIDHEGNDRYLGDIYNQGVGYWYAAGFLYDGGGNDLYEMTQYGQGSGIHLAVGGLIDESGNDTYVMHSGLGQGGSHDYAASILHDRGGHDRYMGTTSCNGCGLTNSVGLFFDRSGNDTYAGRKGSLNHGRPARGFGSVGVLIDLAGKDHYLGIMEDGTAWRHTDVGVGVDLSPPEAGPTKPENTPAAGQGGETVEIPKICDYEGELTQEVFDELWAISIRWQVGENRRIVPRARERLVEFGAPVLPYLDKAMDQGASGLELRAYVDILKGVREGGAKQPVQALLKRNLAHETERRRRVALYLVGELKAETLAKDVVALLSAKEEGVQRRAAGVLAKLGSHAGSDELKGWLKDPTRELHVMAALGTLLGLEADCYADVRPLLDHPLLSVRSRLSTLLAKHAETYGAAVELDLVRHKGSLRALRTLLDTLCRTERMPASPAIKATVALLEHEEWGVRGDAARLLQRVVEHPDLDEEQLAAIARALDGRLQVEAEPYVQFWLRPR